MPNRTRPALRGLVATAGALAVVPLVALLASCSGSGDLSGAASSVASRVSEAGTGLASRTPGDSNGPTAPASTPATAPIETPTAPASTPATAPVETPTEPTSGPATVTETSEVTRTATAVRTKTTTAEPSPTVSAEASEETTVDVAEETAWYASPRLWLALLLLAAVLVAVLVAVRRSSARGVWDKALSDVTDDAQWLSDTFTANLLAQSSPDTLQTVLASGLPRFDDADQRLRELAGSAPDDARRGRANALRAALAELRQSLQHVVDVAASGGPADTQRQAVGLVQQSQAQLRLAIAGNGQPRT